MTEFERLSEKLRHPDNPIVFFEMAAGGGTYFSVTIILFCFLKRQLERSRWNCLQMSCLVPQKTFVNSVLENSKKREFPLALKMRSFIEL